VRARATGLLAPAAARGSQSQVRGAARGGERAAQLRQRARPRACQRHACVLAAVCACAGPERTPAGRPADARGVARQSDKRHNSRLEGRTTEIANASERWRQARPDDRTTLFEEEEEGKERRRRSLWGGEGVVRGRVGVDGDDGEAFRRCR
jgi:hypothetical protein